jgi:hypothetical protein
MEPHNDPTQAGTWGGDGPAERGLWCGPRSAVPAPGDLRPNEDAWLAFLDAAGLSDHAPVLALSASTARPAAGDAPSPAPARPAATRPGGPAIVAVIDDAVAVLHRRFRRGNGTTRINGAWFMAPPLPGALAGAAWGRVLDRADIDALIASGDEASAYARLMADLFPPSQPRGLCRAATHGTHVADLAAGALPGMLDGVEILVACLPPRALRDTSGADWAGDLVMALHWVVRRAASLSAACKAGPRPLVINLSLGTSAGPKDGTSLPERALVQALSAYEAATGGPARACLAFGNDHRTQQVARLAPAVGAVAEVGWQVPPDDRAGARALVMASGPVRLALVPPGGGADTPVDVPPGTSVEVRQAGRVVARIAARAAGPGLDVAFDLDLHPTRRDAPGPLSPAGRWRIRVGRAEVASDADVFVQVHRGDTPPGQRLYGRQSHLVHPDCAAFDPETRDWSHPGAGPVIRSGTHSALATAQDRRVFAVGAAGLHPAGAAAVPRPARYSAAGSANPAWTARQGPDATVAAELSPARPGVVAAATGSGGAARFTGTSVAAPGLARWLARELGPGGILAGGASPDEIGALVTLRGARPGADDPARQGRGWLPASGARRMT